MQALDEESVLEVLPTKIKSELAIQVHLDTLKRVKLFQVRPPLPFPSPKVPKMACLVRTASRASWSSSCSSSAFRSTRPGTTFAGLLWTMR